MTYFKKPDHSYHRAIFEFTNTEIKAAGFKQINLLPNRLEILTILNRLAEADEKQRQLESPESLEKFCEASLGIAYHQNALKELHEFANAGNYEIAKTLLEQIHADNENILKSMKRPDSDLQRKKDAWKAKALRLISFLNDKDEEIKSLNEIIDYHAG